MDLNDLRYFALVVEHGGFSAAARVAHLNKSKLSRRIAVLEEALGVRLLQRSTRRLALTDAGRAFHEHCAAMVVEANAAHDAIAELKSEPSGTVRMTCPVTMAQYYVAPVIGDFMATHRKVRIELDATDRVVNLIEDRIDIALHYRVMSAEQPGLIVRRLASGRMILVASPAYVAARGNPESPQALADHDTIGTLREGPVQEWKLFDTDSHEARISHAPRLLCSDFGVQYQAAARGVGVALLPLRIAWRGLADGTLTRVASNWATVDENIHAMIASRRGMLPSVRAVLDHLIVHLPTALGP